MDQAPSHRDDELAQLNALRSMLAERDAELAAEKAKRAALESSHARLWQSYEELKQELALIKRRMFVATAERVDTTQLQLEFDELVAKLNTLSGQLPVQEDAADDPSSPPGPGEGQGGRGKGSKGKRKGGGRRDLSEVDLPQERVELPDALFEQLVAEGKAERIGFEESFKLGYRRGGAIRICIARAKYRAVGGNEQVEIETAPVPAQLLRRCLAAPSLLAHIAASKCHRGLPLYRIEEMSHEWGCPIDRGSMSRWLEQLGGNFNVTIVAAMDADARQNAFVIMTDATGFAVQPGRFKPGDPHQRRPCRKGHFFVRIADRDHILFDFADRHTTNNVRALFRDFEGYVQADAASVYDALFRPSDPDDPDDDGCQRIEVACWSHARRKYWEAALAKQVVARAALVRVAKIFEVDAHLANPPKGKAPPPSKLKALRQVHLRPLVDEFLVFAEQQYAEVKDERGPLRSALGYTVRQAEAMRAFLQDGRLRLDNNPSENQLRKVVRIRDASLFAGSDMHAESTAGILTLIASARLHNLDPECYLRDVIRVLPHWPRAHYLRLAPKYWAQTRALLCSNQLAAEYGPLGIPDFAALELAPDMTGTPE